MILSRRRVFHLAALCLGVSLGARAQTPPGSAPANAIPTRPWQVGDPAPSIEGVHLGDTEAAVRSVLGEPDPAPPGLSDPTAELQTLRYRHGGLMVGVSRTAGVVRILLRKPQGGALAGVRVGDRLGLLIRRWGEPPAGGGSIGRYPMGDWTVSVRGDMGPNIVVSIMLARPRPASSPPPPIAAPSVP